MWIVDPVEGTEIGHLWIIDPVEEQRLNINGSLILTWNRDWTFMDHWSCRTNRYWTFMDHWSCWGNKDWTFMDHWSCRGTELDHLWFSSYSTEMYHLWIVYPIVVEQRRIILLRIIHCTCQSIAFTTFVIPRLSMPVRSGPLPRSLLQLNWNLYKEKPTSRIPVLECSSYSDRLALRNLDYLALRHLRSEVISSIYIYIYIYNTLIFCYKIFNNLVAIEAAVAFQYRHTTSLHTRSSQKTQHPCTTFLSLEMAYRNPS